MLGMEREHPRRMIGDRVWEELKAAFREAKHSRAGAPAELSDRDFLEAVWYLNRVGCPWRIYRPIWATGMQFPCAFDAGKSGEYGGGFGSAFMRMLRPSPSSVDGLDNGTSPPARRRSTKKNGGDQALGRSRGGLSTKIHAATIDENCSVALHLTAGDAHEGRQFESLYESLDPDNVLESATMDKGYDADRIRERLITTECRR